MSKGTQTGASGESVDNGVPAMLRDLSGIDDAQARAIVEAWRDWQPLDVLNTIVELRQVADTELSLEFDAMFRAAISFPVVDIRLECVRALSNGGSLNNAQALLDALKLDASPHVRAAAALSLHAFSDPSQTRNTSPSVLERISDALRNAVLDDEKIVRGKALQSFAAINDDESTDLIDTMFDEAIGDPELMSDVLLAMGETDDRTWLPVIEDAFYSSATQIRISAVTAFGNLATDDDVESLTDPFDDHVLEVQMATVQALGNIGTPRAREMLELAVSSSEPDVQRLAQSVLDMLKAEDDLMYAVSPNMVAQGLFGVPMGARKPPRDLSRYDAPTEEGWANISSEGRETDIAETSDDIGEDLEDYFESDEFFRESNID